MLYFRVLKHYIIIGFLTLFPASLWAKDAVLHQALSDEAHPRTILVSYPGGVNICWDTETMNLSFVSRGPIVGSMGSGEREAGHPAAGEDLFKTAQGLPVQVLKNAWSPWVPESAHIQEHEDSSADSEEEKTVGKRHPEYTFYGYDLDENQFPTFKYGYREITVSEKYESKEIDGVISIVRKIYIRGMPDYHMYMRLADTGSMEIKGKWINVGDFIKIRLEGVMPVVRNINGNEELLVVIDDEFDFEVIYRWDEPYTKS